MRSERRNSLRAIAPAVSFFVLLALHGLIATAAKRAIDQHDPSICKQSDIAAVPARLGEAKSSLPKGGNLASPHLFCPGADAIASDTQNRFSPGFGFDAGGGSPIALTEHSGRAPPAAA